MYFQALTNAPRLREGVSLSFMAIPQHDPILLPSLEIGAQVTLRLGYCCAEIREGEITAVRRDPARATLTLGGERWALEPAAGTPANAVPGIRSEVWRVCAGQAAVSSVP